MKKIALYLLVVIIFISCQSKEENNKISEKKSDIIKVEAIAAKQSLHKYNLKYSGIVEASVSIPLSFQVPGMITKLLVDEGDLVYKGQKLAEVDKASLQSSYKAALATKEQAQDAYNRLKKVHDKGSLPEIKWEEVKAKLEQANSMAYVAQQNLANCTLIAPSAGIIGTRNAEVGENIMMGVPIMTLISIDNVLIKVSVPENEINRIKKNQKADIKIQAIGSEDYEGEVKKIGVVANTISKTYEVKIQLSNSEHKIKPGMVCDVKLNIDNEQYSIAVPYQSVQKDDAGKRFVFVINKQNNSVKKQLVETGSFVNNQLTILSGIKKGDLVVVSGQHKLKNNAKIIF